MCSVFRHAIIAVIYASAFLAPAVSTAEIPLFVEKGKFYLYFEGAIAPTTGSYFNSGNFVSHDPVGREVSLKHFKLGALFGVGESFALTAGFPMHDIGLRAPILEPVPGWNESSNFMLEMICIGARYKLPIKVFENVLELWVGVPVTKSSGGFYEQSAFTAVANYLVRIEFMEDFFAQGSIGIDLTDGNSVHNIAWSIEGGYMPTRYFNFGINLNGSNPLGAPGPENPFAGIPNAQGYLILQPFIYTRPIGGLEIRFAFDYMLAGWNVFYTNTFEFMIGYQF